MKKQKLLILQKIKMFGGEFNLVEGAHDYAPAFNEDGRSGT